MKTFSLALSVALVAGLVGLSAQTAPMPNPNRAAIDKAITVSGCLVPGIEAGSFTLSGATIVGSPALTPAGTAGTAGAEKSSSMEHSAAYQLKGDNLKDLVGHQVEAIGTTSDARRTDKAAGAGAPETMKETLPILTATSVKSLSATCS